MNKYMTAYFTDEEDLLKGVKELKEKGITVNDVLSPFPVHGIDKLLGNKNSRIPAIGFLGGVIGGLGAFIFQSWIFAVDYPMNIGGKPFLSVPSFIPVTFECAILFAAFAMVTAFLVRSNLGLGAKNIIHDEKITDDRFLMLIAPEDQAGEQEISTIQSALKDIGAQGITVKNHEDAKQ